MDRLLVVDFGGQYSHLISRRIRDLGIYSQVVDPDEELLEVSRGQDIRGLIFSGGASSVYEEEAPSTSEAVLEAGVPILGICYGHQLLAHMVGGEVLGEGSGEYGETDLTLQRSNTLLRGFEGNEIVWMNHKDKVLEMPAGYEVLASTANSPVAAFANEKEKIYGVQFHPEVTHTEHGMTVLENFALDICKATAEWDPSHMAQDLVEEAKDAIGDRRAVIGLSGGVDSSTAASVMDRAIGSNLTAVYVDTGLMRHNETQFIRESFSGRDLQLQILDRRERFLEALEGVLDPEEKRKIVGNLFVEVFEEAAQEVGAEVLVQGTIYSDRIESGLTQHSDTIKSHHNVGGLPAQMELDLYEPLRNLYKDEVREVAAELGLPEELRKQHVFPGPGLAIRIVGEVTPEKVEVVREASRIVEQQLEEAGWYERVWMAFAVLLSIRSVGIQGDARSYKYPIVVRVVESEDAMTANFAKIPYDILEEISTKITNEIPQVNRVVYDISNKPPSTMEWE